MFGKNDDLIDSNYKHNATPQAAQHASFGSAGGDFPAAPQHAPAAPVQTAATYPSFNAQEPQVPSFAPQAVETPTPVPQFSDAPAAPEAVAPASPAPHTTNLSFSEMMAQRNTQQQPAAEAAPVTDAIEPEPAVEAVPSAPPKQLGQLNELAEPDYAPLAPATAPRHSHFQTGSDTPQEPAPLDPEEALAEFTPEPAAGNAQEEALQQALAILSSEDIDKAGGETRIRAGALQTLVEKALAQDENALARLNTRGFDLLVEVSKGLPPGSPILDKLVNNSKALFGSELVDTADGKTQQADALQAIANGVGLQGQVAAIQHNQEVEAQSFAQREAEKKAARQEGLPTGQYL